MPEETLEALLDSVIDRFDPQHRARRNAKGGSDALHCPAHDDRKPSLSVNPGRLGDRVVVVCGARCPRKAILDTVGLVDADLFLNHREPRIPAPRRRTVAAKPVEDLVTDGDGHEVALHVQSTLPDGRTAHTWYDLPMPGAVRTVTVGADDARDLDALLAVATPVESASEPKRLTFLRRSQMTKPDLTDTWLVKNFLRPESLFIIAGSSGIGKSWLRTELGLLLAAGHGKFLGFYDVVSDPITVLAVDEENGEGPEWERDGIQITRLGLDGLDLPYYRVSQPGLRLDQDEWQEALTEQVAAYQPGLLLLDSISAMHRFRELRDDQHPVHDFLRDLMAAHRPLSIGLVHHLRGRDKATKRFVERDLDDLRGGGWDQWPDAVGLLSQMANRRALWVAYKRIPYQRLTLLQSQEGPLTFLDDLNAEPEKITTRDDKVLDAIRAGATTVEQVQTTTGQSRATVYDALASLRETGLVAKGTPLRETPEAPTLRLMEDT